MDQAKSRIDTMPLTTWKIMLRRVDQQGYHYVARSPHRRGSVAVAADALHVAGDVWRGGSGE
jgi:hypothetical protein